MDTCNYLTKIDLAHDDIIVIDSAVPGLGYAIDDERREGAKKINYAGTVNGAPGLKRNARGRLKTQRCQKDAKQKLYTRETQKHTQ